MKNAWQYLGYDVSEATTALKALQLGGLAGWNLRKEALTTESGIEIYGKYALSRTDTRGVLGLVGTRHKVIQNEDLAPLLDALGPHFDTAGQISSIVYVTVKLPSGHRIAVVNGHDSKVPLQIMMTPVVGSTLINVGRFSAKIPNTSSGYTAGLTFVGQYLAWFQKTENLLQEKPLPLHQFDLIIDREFGAPDDAGASAATRTRNKLDTMSQLFFDGGRTAYDGLVAMCTWYDHHSPVRGDDSVRARKAILEPGFKNTALNLMLEF